MVELSTKFRQLFSIFFFGVAMSPTCSTHLEVSHLPFFASRRPGLWESTHLPRSKRRICSNQFGDPKPETNANLHQFHPFRDYSLQISDKLNRSTTIAQSSPRFRLIIHVLHQNLPGPGYPKLSRRGTRSVWTLVLGHPLGLPPA